MATAASAESKSQQAFINQHSPFFRLFLADKSDFRAGYTHGFQRDEVDGPGSYTLNRFFFRGEVPIAGGKNFFWRLGGDYGYSDYELDEVRSASTNDSSLSVHRVVGRFGAGFFLSDELLVTGVVRPGLYSDFEDGADFDEGQVYGDFQVVYEINPGTQLVLGGSCDKNIDDQDCYPLGGIRILGSDGKLHISATLPVEARVGYGISPRSELFILGNASGEEYDVSVGSKEKRFSLYAQEIRLGGGFNFWFNSKLSFELEAGMFFESPFEFKTHSPGQFTGDVDESGYITGSFGLAL